MKTKFKFLEHTADVKFLAYGKTLEELFENSANAMIKYLTEKKVKERKKIFVKIEGNDLESLMYNFLEEFLFFLDSEDFLGCSVKGLKIDRENFKLECEIYGDDAELYQVSHIKAVTYNDMEINHHGDNWIAQVVLDV
jgi:SHS2 domain-containing protein